MHIPSTSSCVTTRCRTERARGFVFDRPARAIGWRSLVPRDVRHRLEKWQTTRNRARGRGIWGSLWRRPPVLGAISIQSAFYSAAWAGMVSTPCLDSRQVTYWAARGLSNGNMTLAYIPSTILFHQTSDHRLYAACHRYGVSRSLKQCISIDSRHLCFVVVPRRHHRRGTACHHPRNNWFNPAIG